MEVSPVSAPRVGDLGGSAAGERATNAPEESGGFVGALRNLEAAEASADSAALAGATGDLTSVSDYMIAATEAQLATEVTVAVRNRAIDSFNEIMRMQV